MGIFSWKATTKNGFGKYCVNNNACIMTDFYKPILKGGHTHNHIKNMELRLMLTKKEIKALRKIMKREKKNGRN